MNNYTYVCEEVSRENATDIDQTEKYYREIFDNNSFEILSKSDIKNIKSRILKLRKLDEITDEKMESFNASIVNLSKKIIDENGLNPHDTIGTSAAKRTKILSKAADEINSICLCVGRDNSDEFNSKFYYDCQIEHIQIKYKKSGNYTLAYVLTNNLYSYEPVWE